MRSYKASIPQVRHSQINQPPFQGAGWPEVVGTPLSELAKKTSGIAGVSLGALEPHQQFSVFAGACALTFLLGRTWRPLYLGSAVFGLLAAWKAWNAFRSA